MRSGALVEGWKDGVCMRVVCCACVLGMGWRAGGGADGNQGEEGVRLLPIPFHFSGVGRGESRIDCLPVDRSKMSSPSSPPVADFDCFLKTHHRKADKDSEDASVPFFCDRNRSSDRLCRHLSPTALPMLRRNPRRRGNRSPSPTPYPSPSSLGHTVTLQSWVALSFVIPIKLIPASQLSAT